jgi:Ca2+-binding EF-hand superfamily protein
MRHFYTLGAALAISSFLLAPTLATAQSQTCPTLAPFDPDKDGTLDLAEAKTSASALFEKLNKDSDKDATLDVSELKGHLTAKQINAADPDKDGTLDKAEYLAVVEARFKAANPDNDGTIDCKEADTKAGKALLKLLH